METKLHDSVFSVSVCLQYTGIEHSDKGTIWDRYIYNTSFCNSTATSISQQSGSNQLTIRYLVVVNMTLWPS